MCRKTFEQEKVFNFFGDYTKMILDPGYNAKQNETEQEGTGLKILTPKQMLQRLPIALVQVKAGNNSENLLNELRKIVYSLYQSKEITKKVYDNTIKSIQWNCFQLQKWILYLWTHKIVKLLNHTHLCLKCIQPGFTYSACGPFTKSKERIQKFKEAGDTNYIYRNELNKACFQHDIAYGYFNT